MSFGGNGSDETVSGLKNKFVSEDDLEDRRRKRQEEWEKVRKADDPEEAPEEEYDSRSLFDRLQEQKDKKDAEYQEQFAMRNQVKGLEEDEAEFLDFVSKRQQELDKERRDENEQMLEEFRSARAQEPENSAQKDSKKATKAAPVLASQAKKSQSALLAGAIKRKGSEVDDNDDVKKSKSTGTDGSGDKTSAKTLENQTAQYVAILPGIGNYTDSDENSDSDSDDSDHINTDMFIKTKCHIQIPHHH